MRLTVQHFGTVQMLAATARYQRDYMADMQLLERSLNLDLFDKCFKPCFFDIFFSTSS
jgi:hypothetical protein